jgi:hypothetical protein
MKVHMKMAKADRDDINAAIDLAGLLSNVQDGYYPATDDESSPTFFDEDDHQHLRFFYDRVMELMNRASGGLFRVVGGFCTIMDNNVLDPDSDVVELHPRLAHPFPSELTDDLREVLGWPNFKCAPIAHLMRAAGADIKHKAEDEQAAVLHWMVRLVLRHGPDWWTVGSDELNAMQERISSTRNEIPEAQND